MPFPKIYSFRIGYSNSVLIENGKNSVLIDTGVHRFGYLFHKYLKSAGIQFIDIKAIILTHTHFDHTGNLVELHKLSGAKVIVHKNEYLNLKDGFIRIPAGVTPMTRIISGFGRLIIPRFTSPPPFTADRVTAEEFDLSVEFGIDAKIIPTPGHTKGSQSVLLGNSLISGDTFINIEKNIVFPHFAEDPVQLLKTWKMLFNLNIKEIYPGHGVKFSIDKAHDDFEKWRNRLIWSKPS